MDSKRLAQLQSERNAQANKGTTMQKSINVIVSECRRYIQENSDSYRDKSTEAKKNNIKELIVRFVMESRVSVVGYVDEEGRIDTNKLVDKLTESITDYDILSLAMADDEIYEIRCNCRELKIERDGRIRDYTDIDGKLLRFDSVEQQDIVIRKLIGDVRFTPKDALINASTVEGYRVAAVHSTALSPDPTDSTNDGFHAFVLRKFKKSKMSLGDIIKKDTMSDGMGRTLALTMCGGLTFITAGPTASGKTTTNNAILQSVPSSQRVVLLQNPSEIDLRFKDASGRTYNDVLHLEAKEKVNPTATDPTTVNLMNHILRMSPTFVCFGEFRANAEFALGMTILQAGHPLNATYHAETSLGSVKRFLTAYMAESREGIDTAISTLTNLINIIVVQKIMKDGRRRVLEITEVLGVDPNNKTEPLLNLLYKFEPVGEPSYDENGNVTELPGIHKRVGVLSQRTIDKLRLEGVKTTRFDFLTKDVDVNEVETYTGENIINYGM